MPWIKATEFKELLPPWNANQLSVYTGINPKYFLRILNGEMKYVNFWKADEVLCKLGMPEELSNLEVVERHPSIPEKKVKPKTGPCKDHGKLSMYRKGCRCVVCKSANSKKTRQWKDRRNALQKARRAEGKAG